MGAPGRSPNRTASVDFIDHHLPQINPVFEHPGIEYDCTEGEYLPPTIIATSPVEGDLIPPRPAVPQVDAMRFWSDIFPDCMVELKQKHPEPAEPRTKGCSIRSQSDWEGVRSRLDKAQSHYEVPKRTIAKGLFKMVYRKAADNTEQAKMVSKLLAQVENISPFIATIDILLDAATMASKVREKVTSAFEPEALKDDFESIEFFRATFPKDRKIRKKSVTLAVSVFEAIENAIGFFLSHDFHPTVSRTWRILAEGSEYQGKLIRSIEVIQKHSSKLANQARKAEMHSTRVALEDLIRGKEVATAVTLANSDKLDEAKKDRQRLADEQIARMLNHLNGLFQVAEEREKQWEERGRKREERERRREETARRQSDETNHLLEHLWAFNPSHYQFLLDAPNCAVALLSQFPRITSVVSEANDIAQILSQRARIALASRRRAEAALATGHVRLTWLCSLHDEAEYHRDTVGGKGMIKAFLAQLLRQHTFDQNTLQEGQTYLKDKRNSSTEALCKLFAWLVRKLPKGLKLIVIMDELGRYETDEYEKGMLRTLRTILGLSRDRTVPCQVKVLATSVDITDTVHNTFQDDDDCLLDFDTLEEVDDIGEMEFNTDLARDDDTSDDEE
ncbi:uncharacterized protein BO97DRAFT_464619 [Aspergillus homomorphus CBS 101889]|uniref:Fungal STAND N-terminal Goodbye domain-containing protein n=1 Tax=Aspergillus homomorphus (strain CBS 101889) TaxID=1450537 RepID=A0A395HIX9_ASPHC|nr:hypothetical protein BO97DRAFT_464619 [Aspergillus homomorphus CBS 101889]RAL07135.1 hypothetical protein BO97DRAFT_464619 [Aspergillus homomorphus CBS 101889]